MKKWQIKTRKDWCITFIFVFLILLVLAEYNSSFVRVLLIQIFPDKMNYSCYPKGYDVFLIVTVGMSIFTTIVSLYKKKSIKIWGSAIIIGLLLSCGLVFGFQYHCKLIVGTAETLQPQSGIVNYQNYATLLDLSQNDERLSKLSKLVYELEPLPKEEQKLLREKEREFKTQIWIRYPNKYKNPYWMLCYVDEDEIYMTRNGESTSAVFYKDNGLLKYLKELEKDSE